MKNNNSVMYKELNLPFVYIAILLVGIIIVFTMASYIKIKVEDFTNDYTINSKE